MSEITRKLRDEILLIKMRHGSREAFATVYDVYVDAIYRFIFYRVATPEIAEDITSELFLKLWQYLTNNTSNEIKIKNLRAYLYQTARNLIADHYRLKNEDISLDELVEAGDGKAETDNIEQIFNLQEIENSLLKIKPEWREVIVLAHVEGLPHQEIAEILGKTPAATRVILHRALRELRQVLGVEKE